MLNTALTLNMGFGAALSQKLQAPLGKVDDFTLVVLLRLVLLGFNLLIGDLLDHVDNIV